MSSAPHTISAWLAAQGEPRALADVVESVAAAGCEISAQLRRARLNDVVGALAQQNVQGEQQQKLDVLADTLLEKRLAACAACALYVSEERAQPVPLAAAGAYALLADPLDGSSNIDVAVPVGTIFGVLPVPAGAREPVASALQPGRAQCAAGYLLYGSSTLLVLAVARGVALFVLDPARETFTLVEAALALPAAQKIYSVNEAYAEEFAPDIARFLKYAHAAGYSARYIGSMVADVHRTLLKGGVFLYPATRRAPAGKLRLLYEANPMAYIMERAGGKASTGSSRILDITPASLHVRTPVILGDAREVEQITRARTQARSAPADGISGSAPNRAT